MSVDKKIKKVFNELLSKVPTEQKKKKFIFLCFGHCQIDLMKYRNCKIFNIESDKNEITIISEDDFNRLYLQDDVQEAEIVE